MKKIRTQRSRATCRRSSRRAYVPNGKSISAAADDAAHSLAGPYCVYTMLQCLRLQIFACSLVAITSADWLDDYALTDHRRAFENLGITASDLAKNIEAADIAQIKSAMKKYEALRFESALADARSQQRGRDNGAPELSAFSSLQQRQPRSLAATTSRYELETQLKAYLLGGSTTGPAYDKTVAPVGPAGTGGVPISLGLNIYHVYNLDLRMATLGLHLWMRMTWVDARLQWDPDAWGGVNSLTFVASPVAIEESQIWVPEIELYSGALSTFDLPRKEVIVHSDGSTFWSRPGEVSSMCQLSGLNNFPFDQVECSLRFGGWSLGGSVQNLTHFELNPIDDTLPKEATYQEYQIITSSVQRGVDSFSCCPDPVGWPYVEFAMTLVRAEKTCACIMGASLEPPPTCPCDGLMASLVRGQWPPWCPMPTRSSSLTPHASSSSLATIPGIADNIKIIMLNIVLTYLSFGVFLLDPKTGERLQFSTTVLLTIVAADSLVTGVVPVCRPVLWIEYFFLVCWVFCVASIVGNMVSRTGLDPVSSAP